MLETSRVCGALFGALLTGCAMMASPPALAPADHSAPGVTTTAPAVDTAAEEAKALLAQAETDVQRARAKRALWLKAWEDLVVARQAVASKDHARASRHARRASEFAQLGLEQLAFPAVR